MQWSYMFIPFHFNQNYNLMMFPIGLSWFLDRLHFTYNIIWTLCFPFPFLLATFLLCLGLNWSVTSNFNDIWAILIECINFLQIHHLHYFLTLLFTCISHINKVMQKLWQTWAIICHYCVLFHLPFPWCSCVCCDSYCCKYSCQDIIQETHVLLCVYGFDGIVELHKQTQQWNNGGDKVLGDNGANKIFKGVMAKGGFACAMMSMGWIFSHIV